jgi:DNA polymerase III subunit delta'
MSFSDILGQSGPVSVLRRSLAAGKLAHAYIFEGTEGCGKKKAAMALVAAIFCGREEGCGECPSCRKVAAFQHPDLHLVEPEGAFIKIDQIRDLQKNLSYRPFEARKKVCIMEAAESMNTAAANAFLKTLEEPPGDSLLILLTANIGAVLPTIQSRCQRLSFSPLPLEVIEECLRKRGLPGETARIAASLAEGSLKKALEVASEDTLRKREDILERIGSLSLHDITPLFALAEELGSDRDKALEVLDVLTIFWRDVLFVQSDVSTPANAGTVPLLRKEAEQSTPDMTIEKIDSISRSRKALRRNVNPRLALEVLFMGLAGK